MNAALFHLRAGHVLKVVASAVSAGQFRRIAGATAYTPTYITAGQTRYAGPFTEDRDYELDSDIGALVATSDTPAAIANAISPLIVCAAPNTVSTTAAIGVDRYHTNLANSGVADLVPTLADGVAAGQLRRVQMTVRTSNDCILTPVTPFADGSTTLTFSAVGQAADLMWDGSNWRVLALYSVLDGAAAPVLA